MEIVGGMAGGLSLISPRGSAVRPTSVRARKALFDSLGDLTGLIFADLCAGSGAMGLEAASRGAQQVYFIECAPESLNVIERNCRKIRAAGVNAELTVVRGSLPEAAEHLRHASQPDLLFADPPYRNSARLLDELTKNEAFTEWASNGRLFWELPEGGTALRPPAAPWKIETIRTSGAVRFMILAQNREKS